MDENTGRRRNDHQMLLPRPALTILMTTLKKESISANACIKAIPVDRFVKHALRHDFRERTSSSITLPEADADAFSKLGWYLNTGYVNTRLISTFCSSHLSWPTASTQQCSRGSCSARFLSESAARDYARGSIRCIACSRITLPSPRFEGA